MWTGIPKNLFSAVSARNDTIYSYAYAASKPNPIGGSTDYYSITRVIPAKWSMEGQYEEKVVTKNFGRN